jgi:hypothetical protein
VSELNATQQDGKARSAAMSVLHQCGYVPARVSPSIPCSRNGDVDGDGDAMLALNVDRPREQELCLCREWVGRG